MEIEGIKYTTFQCVFTGLYYAVLLGGKYDNCYGQGRTIDEAKRSLKIRVNQLNLKNMINN